MENWNNKVFEYRPNEDGNYNIAGLKEDDKIIGLTHFNTEVEGTYLCRFSMMINPLVTILIALLVKESWRCQMPS